MGEFFGGWKRKFGVFTLALACIGSVWWGRSFLGLDGTVVYGKWNRAFGVASARGQLEWQVTRDTLPIEKMNVPIWFARQRGRVPYYFVLNEDNSAIQWTWRWFGFGSGELPALNPANDAVTFIITPYWFFVFPLTVLSAWLLLGKPRSKPASLSTPELTA